MPKSLKDPNNTHKYSFEYVKIAVVERLRKKNIKIDSKNGFNKNILSLIIKFYNIKENKKFAYKHKIGNQEQYTYSEAFVEFIITEIEKKPNIFVSKLKAATEKN